jgi:hypothetical protein
VEWFVVFVVFLLGVVFLNSDVEKGMVNFFELRDNPDKFLIFDINQKMVCKRCKKPLTIRKKKKYISFLCGCGCRLFYPVGDDGVLPTTYVDAKAYYEKTHGGK